MKYCAICADPIHATGKPILRPLGKDDALVGICASCDTEPAYEKQGHTRGYEAPGSSGGLDPYLDAIIDKYAIPEGDKRMGLRPASHARRAGHKIGRIRRRQGKKVLQQREAFKLALKKWGRETTSLVATPVYYVFQYPVPTPPASDDALKPIAKFKRK